MRAQRFVCRVSPSRGRGRPTAKRRAAFVAVCLTSRTTRRNKQYVKRVLDAGQNDFGRKQKKIIKRRKNTAHSTILQCDDCRVLSSVSSTFRIRRLPRCTIIARVGDAAKVKVFFFFLSKPNFLWKMAGLSTGFGEARHGRHRIVFTRPNRLNDYTQRKAMKYLLLSPYAYEYTVNVGVHFGKKIS